MFQSINEIIHLIMCFKLIVKYYTDISTINTADTFQIDHQFYLRKMKICIHVNKTYSTVKLNHASLYIICSIILKFIFFVDNNERATPYTVGMLVLQNGRTKGCQLPQHVSFINGRVRSSSILVRIRDPSWFSRCSFPLSYFGKSSQTYPVII